MDDEDFGADADFLAALAATDVATKTASRPQPQSLAQRPPPTAPRIQQPTPQRIQRPGTFQPTGQQPRIVQPTPQALGGPGAKPAATPGSASSASTGATRVLGASGSSILVSPRQKGNPILAQLRSVPWEYSDMTADYGLGPSTVALFLSLKYHRLHPEYIFARFRGLQAGGGPKHRLRILLALVDIENHEETLRELAKTSLVNQVTLILCWSAAEAARYLELYKTFENASNFSAIRGQQAAGYAERLVQFATVPRAVNKSDAVALVGSFGSLRRAVLAEPEELGLVTGWGEKKVKAWRRAVEAPFRVQKGKRAKGAGGEARKTTAPTAAAVAQASTTDWDDIEEVEANMDAATDNRPPSANSPVATVEPVVTPPTPPPPQKRGTSSASAFSPSKARGPPEELSAGIAAALAKLREK
ncbi:ssDNA endonuclease and repair protein rad10 [Sporothrix epigloea]|uniref:SsDNA endonuclease and repair protein rad10 n=1 Tax=Sporothrix epigloea TaxID=1892477 RepID=A0ABP0DUR6_9PEZI